MRDYFGDLIDPEPAEHLAMEHGWPLAWLRIAFGPRWREVIGWSDADAHRTLAKVRPHPRLWRWEEPPF